MKTKPQRISPIRFAAAGLMALCLASSAVAATINKADNTNNLNLTTSWVGGTVPGAGDVAAWDSTVTINNTTNILGANATWSGIKILNPAGALTITTNSGGNTLTLGADGIDMRSATANLTLSNRVALAQAVAQSWSVGSGVTLKLGDALTRGSYSAAHFDTTLGGTINIPVFTNGTTLDHISLNGSDFVGIDGSLNVVPGATVKVYQANPDTTPPNLNGAYDIVDIYNGSTTGANGLRVSSSANFYFYGLRFNTPHSLLTGWTVDASSRNFYINYTPTVILLTTNLGSDSVTFVSGSGSMRWNGTTELLLDQENTYGDFIFNGNTSQANPQAGILTKVGAGRVVVNSGNNMAGPGGAIRVLEGNFMVNGSTPWNSSNTTVAVQGTGKLSGSGLVRSKTTLYAGGTIAPGDQNGVGSLTLTNGLLIDTGASKMQFYTGGVPATNTVALLKSEAFGGITNNGAVTVDILSGSISVGQYPLISAPNGFTGSGTYALGIIKPHVGAYLSNNLTTASIDLVVTNVAQPLTWATGSGTWQTNGSSIWNAPVIGSTVYQETAGLGDAVLFEDSLSGSSPITVTVNNSLSPSSTTISNITKSYTLSGSGSIAGGGALTKAGSGTLTLGMASTFTGGINLNGGTTVFSALDNLGAGGINFGGGTLQYNGNSDDLSARTVTLGAGGGTINVGSSDVSFANGIGNGGAGGLTKAGSGSLTLNLTNNYTGNTVVSNGKLILNGGAYIASSAAIIVNSGTYFDVSAAGNIDLNGAVSQKLAGNGTVLGGVTLNSGASISPLTNGSVGTLTISNGNLTLNTGGTLMMDISSGSRDQINVGTSGYGLSINGGTLALNVTGTLPYGSYTLITYPSASLFTGAGSVASMSITGFSQAGAVATLDGSVDGQINLVVSATASDNITWSGTGSDWDLLGTTDWYVTGTATPWAFTNGDVVVFDEVGSASPYVSLKTSVSPSAIIVSNDVTAYTIADGVGGGAGKISGTATLTKTGAATLTVDSVNDTTGNVVINGGTLQVSGHLGSGNISNNTELVFSQSTSRTLSGTLSGAGNLTQQGSATLTLAADSPQFTGGVSINGGILQLGNGGATGSLGTSKGITNNATLSLNKSGSYTFANAVEGSGGLTKAGSGTATLTASNSYTGNTAVSVGKLIYGSANAHAGSGAVSVSAGATNDLGGYSVTVSALSGSGRIVNNSGSATNSVTITGAGDATLVIADNDGTGGKVQLVKDGTGDQFLRGASTFTGGTIINAGSITARGNDAAFGTGPITLNGGTLHIFSSTLANPIQVLTNSGIYSDGNSTMNGSLTGTSNITVTCAGVVTSGQTLSWGSGANLSGYSGTFYCVVDNTTYGRFWRWTASGGSASAAWDLQGNFNMSANSTGYTVQLGALSGTNGTWLSPNSTTYIIGGRNESTTFSGNVTGSGTINKVGSGVWTLNGGGYGDGMTNFSSYTFSGATVVSNGTLHLTAAANPTNSSSIRILSGATLDIGGLGYAILETNEVGVVTNIYTAVTHRLDLSTNGNAQTLTGGGTLRGSVVAYSNSVINPGDGIGTLTVATNVTLGGTLLMELNITNSPATNDMLVVGGTLTCGGTLTVTNVGPAFVGGETFKLFSGGVTGFAATNLPALSGSMYWTNKLAVDGTISVINPIATYSTNITATVNGSSLEITWPATHLGWYIEVQTNSLSAGLSNNWVAIPGTATVLGYTNTFDAANGSVFYRLRKP